MAAAQPDDLEPVTGTDPNHPSFRNHFGEDAEAAGLALVRGAVEAGFGELFADSIAAETALGVRSTLPLETQSRSSGPTDPGNIV